MKEAQKAIEAIGPQMEKMKIDELKKLDKMKIEVDESKIESS